MKALKRLNADLAALRRAAPRGNVDKETDRFLLDVATAKIDNKRRTRMIDLAMGSLANQCEQCFQALEAARPIPEIAHAHTGQACRSTG